MKLRFQSGSKNRVGEPLHQQVLHGLLPEVVVDAIDLKLLEHLLDRGVQRAGRIEVLPKRLLDDDLRVVGLGEVFPRQSAVAEMADDRREHRWRRGDVEQRLHFPPHRLLDPADVGRQPVERRPVVVGAGDVGRARRDPVPHVRVEFTPRELLDVLRRPGPEFVIGNRLPPEADEVEVARQKPVVSEIVHRRDQLARGQIARSPEDHDHGRRRAPMLAQSVEEGMALGFGHVVVRKLDADGRRCKSSRAPSASSASGTAARFRNAGSAARRRP